MCVVVTHEEPACVLVSLPNFLEWSPAEKVRVCWNASLALTVPRRPSPCRGPMLIRTRVQRLRVPGLRIFKARTCGVWSYHGSFICRTVTNGGHTHRCFVSVCLSEKESVETVAPPAPGLTWDMAASTCAARFVLRNWPGRGTCARGLRACSQCPTVVPLLTEAHNPCPARPPPSEVLTLTPLL